MPALGVRLASVASADAARVTATVYVCVVTPSSAATTTGIAVAPTANASG
ncbi:hypothetical protein [Neoaquamicrobium sediminum]